MAVVDITHLLDKEEGTSFDQESILFQSFDDGAVFGYDNFSVKEINTMFERDGKSQTLEKVLTLPIRGAPHGIKRGESSKTVADFIEKALFSPANNGGMSTSMNLLISQMTQAIVYKKSYFEKVFTDRDGRIIYDKVAWRPASTCSIWRDQKNGAFKGFRQMPVRMEDTDEIKIPAIRAFVYIHGTHRNPMDGVSDLDIAYWCYQTKQKIRFLWYQFLEGQSLPKTIVKARDETTANRAAKKLIALRNGGVAGITDDVEIQAHESSGKGADQFKAALQWLESEASNSVLAGFTDLGATAAGGTGSFALSKDQTDFFLMSEQAKSKEMADCINQYLIPDLVRYNFGPREVSPTFEFGPIAEDDAQMAVNLLQATAVTESPVLPRAFYEELIERVAGFLNLNTQIVRDGLDKARKEAEEKAAQQSANPSAPGVAGVAAAVDTAAKAVISKQIREAPDVTAPAGADAE